jgi:hypothetical protein
MTSENGRYVSRYLSGVLAELELLRPEVVDIDLLQEILEGLGDPNAETEKEVHVVAIADRLRRSGWLLPLRTRGTWEFAPAARSGAFRSGDPFTELRAFLAKNPKQSASVAMESSAFRLGFASHPPQKETVAIGKEVRRDGALSSYRLVRLDLGPGAVGLLDAVPCHTVDALLVSMAIKPTAYRDWPNVSQWLTKAAATAHVLDEGRPQASMQELLQRRPIASWARAAYLLKMGGNTDGTAQLLKAAPGGPTGPIYLGKRKSDSMPGPVWDQETGVYDSLLAANDTTQEPTHWTLPP